MGQVGWSGDAMSEKKETPHRGQPARTISCNCLNHHYVSDYKHKTHIIQPPKMGALLRFLLNRYTVNLIPLAKSGDKIASRMIDGCNNLLIESERLERRQA